MIGAALLTTGSTVTNEIDRLKRDAGYVFWVFAEQAVYLALPRLLFFPLAAYIIGKEGFGLFSTAMSVTLILGMQPQNGLATGLLRHLSDYAEDRRPQFLATSMRLSHIAMTIIVSLMAAGALAWGMMGWTSWRVAHSMVPLVLALYPENQFILALTEQRYLRQFRDKALWMAVRSVLIMIVGIAGALITRRFISPDAAVVGLSWGYLMGDVAAYAALRIRRNRWYRCPHSPEMTAVLKAVWFKITLAGVLTVSLPHINRLVLSYFHSYDAVADFVAATSVMFVFLAPIQCFGILILSLISKYASLAEFSPRGKLYCLSMLLMGAVVLPLVFHACGPILARTLFPRFGPGPVALLPIVLWMIPAGTVFSVLSPFVLKFSPIRTIPMINAVTFIATVVPALTLIPRFASRGAAHAIIIGNAVSSLLFAAAFLSALTARRTPARRPTHPMEPPEYLEHQNE